MITAKQCLRTQNCLFLSVCMSSLSTAETSSEMHTYVHIHNRLSQLLTQHKITQKNKLYVWEYCPDAFWAPASSVPWPLLGEPAWWWCSWVWVYCLCCCIQQQCLSEALPLASASSRHFHSWVGCWSLLCSLGCTWKPNRDEQSLSSPPCPFLPDVFKIKLLLLTNQNCS